MVVLFWCMAEVVDTGFLFSFLSLSFFLSLFLLLFSYSPFFTLSGYPLGLSPGGGGFPHDEPLALFAVGQPCIYIIPPLVLP